MTKKHPFEHFLEFFIPVIEAKNQQLNESLWQLETTGDSQAASLKTRLETELRLLYSDQQIFEKLIKWSEDSLPPLLKRQLNVLIRHFKQNLLPKDLIEEITKKETDLLLFYANFRPQIEDKNFSENDIREILKNENDPKKRLKAWEASTEIGNFLAPKILDLVHLRNQAAQKSVIVIILACS